VWNDLPYIKRASLGASNSIVSALIKDTPMEMLLGHQLSKQDDLVTDLK
jgi:hypothetical protein